MKMTADNTGYDKYCKENDEEWEKEKKIKVTSINNTFVIFYGCGPSKYNYLKQSRLKYLAHNGKENNIL